MTGSDRSGKIITFYSYKGGTGRSMALANVAWILASRGKRVLVVDWDLEAPGLHRYFHPFLTDKELAVSEGLIDLMIEYSSQALSQTGDDVTPDWFVPMVDFSLHAVALKFDYFSPGGKIHFVPAGRQGPAYATRVNSFDWRAFYERLGGSRFLEAVKEKMREDYDYVLIDSRTGVSDTSGICTVTLPDSLVICFTLNTQNIDGACWVAESIRAQRSAESLPIWPLRTRVELAETDKLDAARDYAEEKFDKFIYQLTPKIDPVLYWGEMETLYIPFYSYEETLAAFRDRPGDKTSMLNSYEQLTRHLTAREVFRLPRMPAEVRKEYLARFARKKPQKASVEEIANTSPELQGLAKRVINRERLWQESGSTLDLLAYEEIERLEAAPELLLALRERSTFRTYWDASLEVLEARREYRHQQERDEQDARRRHEQNLPMLVSTGVAFGMLVLVFVLDLLFGSGGLGGGVWTDIYIALSGVFGALCVRISMRPIDSYVGSVSTFSIAITSVYGGLGAWGMLRLAFDGSSVTDLWLLVSAGFGVGAFTALLPAFAARYLGVNVEITSESRTPN